MSDNGRSKITESQREQLVRVYLESGLRVAGPLAISMGVSPKYPGILASTSGRRRPGQKGTDMNDPRWAWAIQRGAIIA